MHYMILHSFQLKIDFLNDFLNWAFLNCMRIWPYVTSKMLTVSFLWKIMVSPFMTLWKAPHWFRLTSICCLETWLDDCITKSAVWLFLPTIVFVWVIWYVPIPSQTSSPKTSRVFDWLLLVISSQKTSSGSFRRSINNPQGRRLLQTVFFASSVDFLIFYFFFIGFNFSFFFDFSRLFWVNWKSMRPSVVIVLKAAWASFLSSHWSFT